MREIVFDTETTGIDPLKGDRLVEIGAIELYDYLPTGKTFQVYINPERAVNPDAERVHGLSDKFLKDKPKFAEIVQDFLEFIEDSPLIAHNASFDVGFINAELTRCGIAALPSKRFIDTLPMARKKFPGQPNSLDALCNRFNIDKTHRVKHGALLDSELLAAVYLELKGGRQKSMLGDDTAVKKSEGLPASITPEAVHPHRVTKRMQLTEAEAHSHANAIAVLGDSAVWKS
jgi:DNA polymerase III subunit epsilon